MSARKPHHRLLRAGFYGGDAVLPLAGPRMGERDLEMSQHLRFSIWIGTWKSIADFFVLFFSLWFHFSWESSMSPSCINVDHEWVPTVIPLQRRSKLISSFSHSLPAPFFSWQPSVRILEILANAHRISVRLCSACGLRVLWCLVRHHAPSCADSQCARQDTKGLGSRHGCPWGFLPALCDCKKYVAEGLVITEQILIPMWYTMIYRYTFHIYIIIYIHIHVYICCIATILAAALNCDSITKLGSSQFRVRFRCTWKTQSCLKWNQRIWLLPSNVDPMTWTQTDGLQTLVLDLSCRLLRIAQLFMGYTQSFIHLLDSKNYIFLFPTAVTGFQCLGLGVMRHFLPSSKTGTEAQHWNRGALEPPVGLQNLVNYPQDELLSITKCQHRLVSIS